MPYDMVAGIEVHVQLKTKTKLFCGCASAFGAAPNSQVCPVCLGLPGALPVPNRQAVELALRAALAFQCEITPSTKFDRKNYFYPDLPKNYQISQYDLPIARNGHLDIQIAGATKRIGLERIHMEEDAGKLMHAEGADESWVDLNRAGVPLIEVVSRPEIHSPEEAHAYLAGLKMIMQYADVSDCDMEKGSLRCDINISVRPKGSKEFGTRVEIKNLNSFRFAIRALKHEWERQSQVLESGGKITLETRLYDPDKDVTIVMRSKEEAHDYRYFPEPDLPPLKISKEWIDRVRQTLPEMPQARKARLMQTHQLTEKQAETLIDQKTLADFFERCVAGKANPSAAANWIINDLTRTLRDLGKELDGVSLKPKDLVDLIAQVEQKAITGNTARQLLTTMIQTGKDCQTLIREQGLAQVSDTGSLEGVADEIIAANPKAVEDFRGGKQTTMQFLIGQMMKKTQGRANPDVAREILTRKLGQKS